MARRAAKSLLDLNTTGRTLYNQNIYGFYFKQVRMCSLSCQYNLHNDKKLSSVSSMHSSPLVLNQNGSAQIQNMFQNFVQTSTSPASSSFPLSTQIQKRQFFTSLSNSALFDESNDGKHLSKTDSSHQEQNVFYSTKGAHFETGFLKNQSALLVKRSPRKKIPRIHDEGKTRQLNNVVAYALGEEINLEPLKKILMKQGLYAVGELPSDVIDTLHIRGKYNVDQRPKEIFVFDDGSVVFWCVPEVERGAFLKVVMKYCEAPYPGAVILSEREELDFSYVKGQTAVLDDVIQLKDRKEDHDDDASISSNDHILELYAMSNAMSQSVKLSVWEASLEKFVTSIEPVTENVRHGRKISMSRRQLLKKSGELMSLRHLINLSSDLLDTPDFYWDRAYLEPLYQSLCSQLCIAKRTKVMNEKLTHCCELVDLVSRHLSDEHHIRLEVMIIILIMVEVVFEVIHFVRNYIESRTVFKPAAEEEEPNGDSGKN